MRKKLNDSIRFRINKTDRRKFKRIARRNGTSEAAYARALILNAIELEERGGDDKHR